MDSSALNAITDVDTLRDLVREQIDVIAQHERTIHNRDLKIDKLTHELARLRRIQFAAKTERMDPAQRALFDEAMAADLAAVEAELKELDSAPRKAPRRTPVRRPLPTDLERIETVHEPGTHQCGGCGQDLVRIGEHASEKLDVKPLTFFVRRDVYPQYACRQCETVVAEPVAPTIIDRGIVAPGLLAQVAIHKYADHLPLYRQEAIFARHGVELKRQTLAEWIGVIGLRLKPLVARLHQRLLATSVLHADETPVRQLVPGAGQTKRAYLFAYATAGESPHHRVRLLPGSQRQACRCLSGWLAWRLDGG